MPPDAPRAVDAAGFVAALGGTGDIAGVHDGAGRPAGDRISVYRNNVIVSLRDALKDTFPVTMRLMGETFFDAAATAFAKATKPASPMLWRYGEAFPAFLSELPGLADYPFVPEAAAVEFARLEAYHAADAIPLAADALAAVPAEDLARVVFAAHPAARVVPLPAGGLGAYAQNSDETATDSGRAGSAARAALVTRPFLDVLVAPLTAGEARVAAALLGGAPLGQADGDSDVLAAALTRLLSAGAFRALALAEA